MKTTLIIGASSAVGKALAQIAINEGNKVITLSRTAPEIAGTTSFIYDLLDCHKGIISIPPFVSI